MWKFVTRGIRETLERRASCRTNVYSQTSPDTIDSTNKGEVNSANLARNQKFLAPNVVATNNGGFCGSAKSGGPKDKRYHSKWDTGRSWSEAVGWSSVLAVGWVVCQTLCLRRRIFERSKEDNWHNRLLRYPGVRVPLSFVDSFNLHPRHVLPVTNCVANGCIEDRSEHSLKQEWTSPTPFGPITIEEAFKEAKDEYTTTHIRVTGEFELRFGVKALEEKRYKDAVKHFATGASLSSSGSMFNLGLCHELGIGTLVDTAKAAKFYKHAAERGHPDAMYNLGVFHAQGRGGLSLDIERARELFIKAANLGHPMARIALDLEKDVVAVADKNADSGSERVNFVDENSSNKTDEIVVKTQDRMSDSENSTSDDDTQSSESSSEISFYNDNNVESSLEISFYHDNNAESEENSTNKFLNCLGLQTNLMPILVGANDNKLPCFP